MVECDLAGFGDPALQHDKGVDREEYLRTGRREVGPRLKGPPAQTQGRSPWSWEAEERSETARWRRPARPTKTNQVGFPG